MNTLRSSWKTLCEGVAMRWMFAFGFIPVPVFYIEKMKGRRAGVSHGFYIRILKKYKEDKGIHRHELVHCEQFYFVGAIAASIICFLMVSSYGCEYAGLALAGLPLHGLLYKLLPKYRYWAELVAYREQLRFAKDREKRASTFAGFIANYYGLKVDFEAVRVDLLKG